MKIPDLAKIVERLATAQARNAFRKSIPQASKVGFITILSDESGDIEAESTFKLERAFRHQLDDEDWSADECVLWAESLEKIASKLRHAAKRRRRTKYIPYDPETDFIPPEHQVHSDDDD